MAVASYNLPDDSSAWGAAPGVTDLGADASATSDAWTQASNALGDPSSAPASSTPQTSAPAPTLQSALGQPAAPATSAPTAYTMSLQNIQAAPTPDSKAAAQDTLARQVATDLTNEGHDVEWDGAQLIVDGRPYTVGDGSPTTSVQSVGAESLAATDPTASPGPVATAPGPTTPAPTSSAGPAGTAPGPATTPPPTDAGSNTTPTTVDRFAPATFAANYTGPQYALAFVQAYADQPGANPSLKNDPNYWVQKITSGELGSDPGYIVSRFMTPEGSGDAGAGTTTTGDPALDAWIAQAMANPPADTPEPTFTSTAPTYTPGQLTSDPNLTPLVDQILQHPESLDANTVQEMKSQQAEEAAAAAQAQDEDLQHFGGANGLLDSPWLASQRAATAWNRRDTTITGNRNIDIQAAETNQQDKINAATLGIQAAASSANTFQVNEAVKQAATTLGISEDQVRTNFILQTQADLTKNKGIDLGFQMDAAKLAQQSDEFKQNLMYELAALKQADDQFRANYGLAASTLAEQVSMDDWVKANGIVDRT